MNRPEFDANKLRAWLRDEIKTPPVVDAPVSESFAWQYALAVVAAVLVVVAVCLWVGGGK